MRHLDELVLELTDWCPLHCAHCSSDSSRRRHASLPAGLASQLVHQARELGARTISFGGGEPTSAAAFAEILREATAQGLHSEVFTCGTSASEGSLRPLPTTLIGVLRNVERLRLIFSIHGPNPALHDGITEVKESFRCLRSSLLACLEAGIPCELNFVPVLPNFRTFPDVVRFAENHDIGTVSVLRFVPQGRGCNARTNLELTKEDEGAFIGQLMALRARTCVTIRTGSPFNGIIPGNEVTCRAGSGKLVVQANGNVLPCEVFKHRDRRSWGLSVYEKSLAEILDSPRLRELRAALQTNNCLLCPVHRMLRSSQRSGVNHGLSPTAVYA